jgi:hypothetical protein
MVTMQVFVGDDCTMIAASVQCDVDGIPKGAHYIRVASLGRGLLGVSGSSFTFSAD